MITSKAVLGRLCGIGKVDAFITGQCASHSRPAHRGHSVFAKNNVRFVALSPEGRTKVAIFIARKNRLGKCLDGGCLPSMARVVVP